MDLRNATLRLGDATPSAVYLGDTLLWTALPPLASAADDFLTAREDMWRVINGAPLEVRDAQLQIPPDPSYGSEVDSLVLYRAIEDEFTVQVAMGNSDEAYLGLVAPYSADVVYLDANPGWIGLQNADYSFVNRVAWDPAQNWWRLRVSGGRVFGEVSADRQTWTLIASRPWAASSGWPAMGGGTWADTVRYASYNLPQEVVFADTWATVDTARWQVMDAGHVATSGGQLTCTIDGSWTGSIYGTQTFDPAGSRCAVEVAQAASGNDPGIDCWLALNSDFPGFGQAPLRGLNLDITGGVLIPSITDEHVQDQRGLPQTPYDPARHRWLAIRCTPDTAIFEAGPDRFTFTELARWPLPPGWLVPLLVTLGGGSGGATQTNPAIYGPLFWTRPT